MTQKRIIAVLLFFFVLAFTVAHLQAQKIRYARRIAQLNTQIVQLDYQQWQARMRLAELSSPAELLERTSAMALGTVAPNPTPVAGSSQFSQDLAVGR